MGQWIGRGRQVVGSQGPEWAWGGVSSGDRDRGWRDRLYRESA
ncbi:hypothetical protein [Phormidium sp. CCY1219]|nr:hypothetical protein [Phormidium sp. CCY1219]